MDRDFFLGSLIGARDREFAVCRLKPELLKNLREAREPPLYFVCDEQIAPSTFKMSGLKKRLQKKKSEGIEYFSIATANKGYEGQKDEVRAETLEGEAEGKILQQADPVCGGYKLNWIMDVGPRYNVGSSNPSKLFGSMLLLIFSSGDYLTSGKSAAVTDSVYGFTNAMIFLALWVIS